MTPLIDIAMYFFKKRKNRKKGKSLNAFPTSKPSRQNSRQKRKNRKNKETITEAQRLSIVNTILSKKRLLIYTDSF